MAYKRDKQPTKENALQEADVTYYAAAKKKKIVTTTAEQGKESYIKRSVAMLGVATTKPFNKVENNTDFINCIRAGLPRKSLDELMNITGLTIEEIANIIRTSGRTLRRYTPLQKLNAEQSERLIEIAKLYSRGEEVLGNLDTFKEWMNSTVMALGNKKPKEFLDTSLGIDFLITELGRIEHGVFA